MPFVSNGNIRKCKWCDKPAKKYYQGTRNKNLPKYAPKKKK